MKMMKAGMTATSNKLFDAIMWMLGFRVWEEDNGHTGIKVPSWYLHVDPGAKRLGGWIERDMREHAKENR